MHQLNYIPNVLITCLILMTGIIACTPFGTDYRQQGFRLTQKAFESYPETPGLYEVVELKNIKIHIVGNRHDFNWQYASAFGSPVQGYATRNNEIWVIGKRLNDKIIVNQVVLGHELNHLLNFEKQGFANPDNLNQIEFCYYQNNQPNECMYQ